MATRKNRKIRTRRRNQRGGGFFNAIAGVAEKIKGFFSKPIDGSVPSPGVKEGPLFGKKNNSSTSKALPSNAVAITIPTTPTSTLPVRVNNKPLQSHIAIPMGERSSTGPSSLQGVTIPPQPSTNTRLGMIIPEKAMQAPQLSQFTTGGKRKKNKRSKTQRKRN